jgi:hypothetical protein
VSVLAFSGRALTLRNPWGFAAHHLDKFAKDIGCENRDRPPPAALVAPEAPWVALHTGAHHATLAEEYLLLHTARAAGWHIDSLGYWRKGLRSVHPEPEMLSLIPGLFRILSVDAPGEGDLTGWRDPSRYGYRLEYRPLPTPIPCTGPTPAPGKTKSTNLGWWRTPDDVSARIEAVLAAKEGT